MNCPSASITPNASRFSPTVKVWPARPSSGPPCIESATSCRLRPSTAGKSDAAGAEAPCTFSRRPPDAGRLAVPSAPPLSPPPQPATARTAAITAMMMGRRRIAMSLETHSHAAHEHRHHTVAPDADRRRLAAALALILAFMVAEIVAGLLAGSLALLSDAAHMLTDAASLTLALVAARLAARPPSGRFTFGLGRAEVLSAQVNGAALLLLAGVIAIEAVRRFGSPADVEGGL